MFAPPALRNKEEFNNWRREVTIWQCATNLELRKQGPALYLSLGDQAKQYCNDVPIEKLISENGVEIIIDKLQSLYQKYEHGENESKSKIKSLTSLENEYQLDELFSKVQEEEMGLPNDISNDYVSDSEIISEDFKADDSTNTLDEPKSPRKVHVQSDTIQYKRSSSVIKKETKLEPMIAYKQFKILQSDHPINNGTKKSNIKPREYIVQLPKMKSPIWIEKEKSKHEEESKSHEKSQTIYNEICKSEKHQKGKCLLQDEQGHRGKQFTAFTKNVSENYMRQFLSETFNRAVLDSGCSKTVCGKVWLDCYTNSLSREELLKVAEKPSDTRFKFGDGKTIKSIKKVIIPARIGNVAIKIETDVVSADIPLLLSKDSMKAAKTTIDFSNDKVIMLNQTLDLKFTTSGHYCVPITNMDETEVKLLFKICRKSIEEKRRVSSKLHLQFGHMPSDKIITLVKDVGIVDSELSHCIKEAEKLCQSCKSYKKRKLRPVVRFALAKEFNEVISIDLKPYGNVHLFHMIDHSTRYSAVAVIPSKQKDIIVENFMKHWITAFGCPNKIMSDKSGEFNNELYLEMAELFNVEIIMTESECNDIVEKNFSLIRSILDKIRKQSESLDDAVTWAVSAKNSLTNVYDFSPNELVFGKNPSFPTLANKEIPEVIETSQCESFVDHMNIPSKRELLVQGGAVKIINHDLKKKRGKTGDKSNSDKVHHKHNKVSSIEMKRDEKHFKLKRNVEK